MDGTMGKLTTPLWKRKLVVFAQAAAFVLGCLAAITLFCIGLYYGVMFIMNYPAIGWPIFGVIVIGLVIWYVYKALWRTEMIRQENRERQEQMKAKESE